MSEEINETIKSWDIYITAKVEELEVLIASLSEISDFKVKAETLFEISKTFRLITNLNRSKTNMVISLSKTFELDKKDLITDLTEEMNNYHWNTIIYQEMGRKIIKDEHKVQRNYIFFMDIFEEYLWFIKEGRGIRDNLETFDYLTPTPSINLNILFNNIVYTQIGVKYLLDYFERKKDLDSLFLYYETLGDLHILKFLLAKKIFNEVAGISDLYYALLSYKSSIYNKKLTEKKNIHREGIVGFSYQDVLYSLLNEEGYSGSPYNVSSKFSFINTQYSFNIGEIPINLEDNIVDHRSQVFKKINQNLKEIGLLDIEDIDSHDRAWKLILNNIGIYLIHSFNNSQYFRKQAIEWKHEGEMDLWFADKFYQLKYEKEVSYYQEPISGGGKCEHFLNDIPIEDKIIEKSEHKNMEKLLEEQYRKFYPQIKQYAKGKDSKYAIILITDRRAEIVNNEIQIAGPDNCILFRYNKEDDLWVAVFAFQVFLKSPSQLKI